MRKSTVSYPPQNLLCPIHLSIWIQNYWENEHNIKRREISSPPYLQRVEKLGPYLWFFCSICQVNTIFFNDNHINTPVFLVYFLLQNFYHHQRASCRSFHCISLYPNMVVHLPLFFIFSQIRESSSFLSLLRTLFNSSKFPFHNISWSPSIPNTYVDLQSWC